MNFDVNGYRMHYELYGELAGEPLLWLHGWSGTGADWKYIFRDPPPGFRVIGPDAQGNGASTGFQGTRSFSQDARDMFALLEYLGIKKIKAIGLSGGGITLLHMGMQRPARIEAMVVISAPPYFPERARAMQRGFSFESLPEVEQTAMRERSKGGQKQIDWLMQQTRAMAASGDDVRFTKADLAKVSARTLIVFGDKDPLYPIQLAHELNAGIPGSSLWIVPGGGHGPVFGAHADKFADTAIKFLRGDSTK